MRIIIVLLPLLFCAIQSHAQVGFRLGVKGGLNYADIETDISTDAKTGYHFGAFTTLKFTKVAVQPEVIFSRQGSKFTFNGRELESNYDYVNIPILVKLYLAAGLNLQAGPQFGFLTSAQRDYFDGVKTTRDVKNELKDSDLSLALGVGWDIPFGLTLDARYNLGISDISNSEAMEEAKNQVFQISLGVRFIELGN